jgi:hypothetical protein
VVPSGFVRYMIPEKGALMFCGVAVTTLREKNTRANRATKELRIAMSKLASSDWKIQNKCCSESKLLDRGVHVESTVILALEALD